MGALLGGSVKIKMMLTLFVFPLSCFFAATCRNQEDIELLKSHLNSAINESNRPETARLLNKLVKLGVDSKTLPIAESADLIMGKAFRAYNWETTTGNELVQLYGPLEGTQNGTYREHLIRAAYFWGLMETSQRKKALSLWGKSEQAVSSRLGSPRSILQYLLKLPREEMALLNGVRGSIPYFIIGFVSSKDPEDRLQGVELAKKNHRFLEDTLKEDVDSIRLANPIAQAQIMRLIMDESLLAYSLVESGRALDPAVNPYLMDQPDTNIRFELVRNTGFEECGLRTADGGCNRIVIGDYDSDGYADVLIPDHGLWRNLGGNGRFKRVDDQLGCDVKGISGAFTDVNNDGLVDVIIADKDKFGVSLQTKGRMFRPVLSPANGVAVNAAAIGLFDGDGDGLIDVYLARSERSGDSRTVVLRNKGDGTFEDVAKAWGFSGDDVLLPGEGVSPGDYDNDGRTDIFVANYRTKRNTLWRNVSEEKKTAFVQCAAAPWFGTDKRPEIIEGPDRGVEGWQSIVQGTTNWGHTSGAAWGDLNGDGTLDLVCANLAHPRFIYMNPPFISDLSRVYLNSGHGFQDHTIDSGLVYRETNTDPLLADFNNDGHLDLSMTNCYRVWVNQLYEGVGDGSFREVTFRTGAFACNAQGQAAADFDNDGDLDWFVFDGNRGLRLYENKLIDRGNTPAKVNWIEIKLHGGKHTNSMAYGARVTVKADGRSYVREVAGMRGWSSCDDQVVHVGLGEYAGKVNVTVRWIGDRIQEFNGLDINKRHEIYETGEKESK
jgi:hypothetical protein